jgi:hypothetical protein
LVKALFGMQGRKFPGEKIKFAFGLWILNLGFVDVDGAQRG